MFYFEADIVKRRKISKTSLLFGLISAGLLGYLGLTFLELGHVPIIETLIRQIGFYEYGTWVYMGIFALLTLLIIPAVSTLHILVRRLSSLVCGSESCFMILQKISQV